MFRFGNPTLHTQLVYPRRFDGASWSPLPHALLQSYASLSRTCNHNMYHIPVSATHSLPATRYRFSNFSLLCPQDQFLFVQVPQWKRGALHYGPNRLANVCILLYL